MLLLLETILRHKRIQWTLRRIVTMVPEKIVANEPPYSELIAAVLSQCELFLLA